MLKLTRGQILSVFTEWNRRVVEAGDIQPFDPNGADAASETFFAIAAELFPEAVEG